LLLRGISASRQRTASSIRGRYRACGKQIVGNAEFLSGYRGSHRRKAGDVGIDVEDKS
jgi:hypothetical protein